MSAAELRADRSGHARAADDVGDRRPKCATSWARSRPVVGHAGRLARCASWSGGASSRSCSTRRSWPRRAGWRPRSRTRSTTRSRRSRTRSTCSTNKIAPDDPNAKFLQIATKETDRVSRILRQMLGFYRAPRMEPTDMNGLIEEAEALIDKHLRQHARAHRQRPRSRAAADHRLGRPDQAGAAEPAAQRRSRRCLTGGTISVSTRVSHGADPSS